MLSRSVALLLACVSVSLGFSAVIQDALSASVHIDEPTYISYSRWVLSWWDSLVRQEAQQLNVYTLGIPPVILYVTGGLLLLSGRSDWNHYILVRDTQLNWDLSNSTLPPVHELIFIRILMAYLFILSAVILGRIAAPRRGAISAGAIALLVLSTDYLNATLSRVMTESPMIFSLSATALLVVLAIRASSIAARWRWSVLGGVIAGIGIASKHNLALSIPIVGAVLLAAAATEGNRRATATRVGQTLLFSAVSVGVFILLSPVLHPSPTERLLAMVQTRAQIIASQHAEFPQTALPSLESRLDRSANRVLSFYGLLSCLQQRSNRVVPNPQTAGYVVQAPPAKPTKSILCQPFVGWLTPVAMLNASLAVAGLVVFMKQAFRSLPALLLLGSHSLVSIALIPHDWAHYYAIPALFVIWLESLAAVWLVGRAVPVLSKRCSTQ